MEKIIPYIREFWWIGMLGILGMGIMGYGVLGETRGREEARVEIISGDSANQQIGDSAGGIVVDVAGAVVSPGVYKLDSGSRIGDALVAAGGLAENADTAWVAQTINLAEPIKDGGKVYIPAVQQASESAGQIVRESVSQNGRTNINKASASVLEKLVGIGEVRAQAIIDNRPYGSAEELVSKAKVPQSVYEKIKDQVTIY